MADHLIIDAAEHFFRGGIHRANHALFVDRDHAVENVFDDGANAGLDPFQFGQLASHQDKAVTVRNNEQAHREHAKDCQRRCLDDALAGGGTRPHLIDADLVPFKGL